MHHQHGSLKQGQGLRAQPMDQWQAVWRLQYIAHGIARFKSPMPQVQGQQVQIMVAQKTLGTVAVALKTPQYSQVVRPAVDQIAQKVQRVATGGKLDKVQQMLQGWVATLHIANQVHCHGMIVFHSPFARPRR